MLLLKVFRANEWKDFQDQGYFAGSADDLRDGFVHLSTQSQVEATLLRHFAGETGLVIAEVAVAQDPALRMEPSRNGDLFPHLYRPLATADIVAWKVST